MTPCISGTVHGARGSPGVAARSDVPAGGVAPSPDPGDGGAHGPRAGARDTPVACDPVDARTALAFVRYQAAIARVRRLCADRQEDGTGADVDTLWPSEVLAALDDEPEIHAEQREIHRQPTGTVELAIRRRGDPRTLPMAGQVVAQARYPDLWDWATAHEVVRPGLFEPVGGDAFRLPDLRGRAAGPDGHPVDFLIWT